MWHGVLLLVSVCSVVSNVFYCTVKKNKCQIKKIRVHTNTILIHASFQVQLSIVKLSTS